jgi:general secretion pathway protein K
VPVVRPNERGIALLLVLWIFMVLGVIALDFSQYMRDEAMAAVNFSDETRGYYVALAGMNRALFDAAQERESNPGQPRPGEPVQAPRPTKTKHMTDDADDESRVPADGVWHPGDFAGARYEVRMSDEGALIALNKADEALLTRVITNLTQGGDPTKGMDRNAVNDVATIVDCILDYRDPDHIKRLHGNERGAKNAWFDSPEELLRINGVTADLFYGSAGVPGLRDVVSVYNRSGTINVRSVTAPVLQVLLNIDADAATNLVADRDAEGDAFLQTLQAQAATIDPSLAPVLVNEAPRTVRLEARADVSEERNRAWVGAVVDLSQESFEGPRVRRWLDRIWDGNLPPVPATDAERPS